MGLWSQQVHASCWLLVQNVTPELAAHALNARFVPVLSAYPLQVADLKEVAQHNDQIMVVNNASCAHCEAGLFGADFIYEAILNTPYSYIGLSKRSKISQSVWETVCEHLNEYRASDDAIKSTEVFLTEYIDQMRNSSSSAAVLSSYLLAHPHVRYVWYLGDKHSDSFSRSAQILRHGFGATVDFEIEGDAQTFVECVRACALGRLGVSNILDIGFSICTAQNLIACVNDCSTTSVRMRQPEFGCINNLLFEFQLQGASSQTTKNSMGDAASKAAQESPELNSYACVRIQVGNIEVYSLIMLLEEAFKIYQQSK